MASTKTPFSFSTLITVAFAIPALLFLPSVAADATGCGPDLLLLLVPCVPFAQGAAAAPSDPCCNNLADVIREQPGCVCPVLNRSISLPVNQSLVLELPSLCRLNVTADADACHGLALPPSSGSPQASGFGGPNSTSSTAVSPVVESPPPSLRMNNFLLGQNWGGKLRVEGTSTAFAAIILILGSL